MKIATIEMVKGRKISKVKLCPFKVLKISK